MAKSPKVYHLDNTDLFNKPAEVTLSGKSETIHKKIEIEDIDDSDSISSDSLHENAKKIRHKKKSHHHKQAQVPQTPNPHMLLPPYNNNYRYCYYYHLPPPPPSLLKKFKKEAKERSGYYRSPFNEAYLPPPVLLHIPNGVTEQDFPQLARGYNTQYPMY